VLLASLSSGWPTLAGTFARSLSTEGSKACQLPHIAQIWRREGRPYPDPMDGKQMRGDQDHGIVYLATNCGVAGATET
jgi:hypothetical protein